MDELQDNLDRCWSQQIQAFEYCQILMQSNEPKIYS